MGERKRILLVGVGMGNRDQLTREAEEAIRGSGLLLGSARLLSQFRDLDLPQEALIRPRELAAAIQESEAEQIAVLFSGDPGYFSLARSLLPLLEGLEVEVLPGVSSLSCLCARLGASWQDVFSLSCHGRDEGVVAAVQSHSRCFVLTGGAFRVETVCKMLTKAGLGQLLATAGERLSYPEERVVTDTVEALSRDSFADLSVLLVENPRPVQRIFQAPGLSDDAFHRGKVPMTKEEVRALVISKLRLCSRDVLWDVGAGTGSVSVEAALCLTEGTVWAVERRAEACELIHRNREQFQLSNLHLVEGEAPQVLHGLCAPDSVFIGGSSGALRDIVGAALEKNPAVRIVCSAITLETLQEALGAIRHFGFQDTEVVQLSVTRSASVGPYHMMRAENPVYLISMEKPL